MYGIARAVCFHIAVGQTEREVGVRIRGYGQFHLAQAADVCFMQQLKTVAQCLFFYGNGFQLFYLRAGVSCGRVFFDGLYRRFLHEFIEVGAVGKDGVVVHIIYESIVVAFVLALDGLVENGQLFWLQFLGENGQDGFGYGTVYFVVVVFVVDVVEHLFQLCFGSSKQRVVFLFQRRLYLMHNHVRASEFDSAAQGFVQVVELTGNRHSLGNDFVDSLYYTLVFGFTFGKFGKVLFLFRFCAQHIVVDNCLVHADGVFPVVAASGKFAGILDAGFVAGIHVLAQYIEADTTHVNHGLVVCFHAFFHFRPGEVTAGAARESHNHGIIVFFQSFDGNGQEFRSLQRYVACIVFGRFSVGIGIDAEYGEVARVTWPHPVVGFTAELTYRGRGSGYHTHVTVHFVIEQVEFISRIERECSYLDARFTFQITLFQFFFGKFAEERGGQCIDFRHFSSFDFRVYEVGDVYNAVYETEFQSRSRQLFIAAFCPETVCQVIVFH